MLACVDAGNVKKAETPTSPIPTAPETAANIFVKRVMCASLSTGARRCECTKSKTAGQRCALVHAHSIRPLRARLEDGTACSSAMLHDRPEHREPSYFPGSRICGGPGPCLLPAFQIWKSGNLEL